MAEQSQCTGLIELRTIHSLTDGLGLRVRSPSLDPFAVGVVVARWGFAEALTLVLTWHAGCRVQGTDRACGVHGTGYTPGMHTMPEQAHSAGLSVGRGHWVLAVVGGEQWAVGN